MSIVDILNDTTTVSLSFSNNQPAHIQGLILHLQLVSLLKHRYSCKDWI